MMPSRRLLFVVNHARWFLTHRVAIAEAATRAGYEVHVATPPGEWVAQIEARGFRWHAVSLNRSSRNPLREALLLLELIRLVRKVRPDVVHNVSMKPVLYGTIAARVVRTPAVVNAMTGLGHLFLSRSWRDRVLRRFVGVGFRLLVRHPRMRVLIQNEDDCNLLMSLGWLAPKYTVIVRSAVDTRVFSPSAISERKDGIASIVLPARMLRTKGVPEFVEAARTLKEQGVRARFILVGAPDLSNPATLRDDELAAIRADGAVEYWGDQTDMISVYRCADIVCLPSHREGLPKVLLEASACGIPIVTTDAPGCRHVVTDGDSGLLVPVGDARVLASALRTLINNPDMRRRMGARARERALTEFSNEKLAAVTLQIYDDLLRAVA